jgi:hypothetical protein
VLFEANEKEEEEEEEEEPKPHEEPSIQQGNNLKASYSLSYEAFI